MKLIGSRKLPWWWVSVLAMLAMLGIRGRTIIAETVVLPREILWRGAISDEKRHITMATLQSALRLCSTFNVDCQSMSQFAIVFDPLVTAAFKRLQYCNAIDRTILIPYYLSEVDMFRLLGNCLDWNYFAQHDVKIGILDIHMGRLVLNYLIKPDMKSFEQGVGLINHVTSRLKQESQLIPAQFLLAFETAMFGKLNGDVVITPTNAKPQALYNFIQVSKMVPVAWLFPKIKVVDDSDWVDKKLVIAGLQQQMATALNTLYQVFALPNRTSHVNTRWIQQVSVGPAQTDLQIRKNDKTDKIVLQIPFDIPASAIISGLATAHRPAIKGADNGN